MTQLTTHSNANSMKNNREYRLIVRLTHDEGKAVAEAAQAANLSMSDLVRSLLFEQPKVKHSVMLNAKKTQRSTLADKPKVTI
jgi:prolyl-tRNA editing enzyme YbaK/EbsC (Cys-tRNA(Pro) deacylase)